MRRNYVFKKIAEEFWLTPAIISRIVKPLNFGSRGGKLKSSNNSTLAKALMWT